MGAISNFATNLRGSSPRAKLFLACMVLDIAFLALMATSSAGPLANPSIYWSRYNSATMLGVTTDVTTGIWGNCRDPVGSPQPPFCLRWTDDPYFGRYYSSALFQSMIALQVISGVIMFFGAMSLAFLNPIPMLVSSLMATMFFIPVFGMTTYVMNDIGQYIQPYASMDTGPGFGCGVAALVCCILSTIMKGVATKVRGDGEVIETTNNLADAYKY